MAACRKSDDPDAVGVNFPCGGVGFDGSYGALRVSEGNEGVAFWESVLEDDPCDAVLVEPFGDAVTLGSGDEAAVTAARADDEGGAGRVRGEVDRDCGGARNDGT